MFTDVDLFRTALSRFELIVEEETYSDYLGNATTQELEVGENTVGAFVIDIESEDGETDAFVSEGDGEGVFTATYEKDVTEIVLDDFEEGKLHAFAATWDIDQDWSDYVEEWSKDVNDWGYYEDCWKEGAKSGGDDCWYNDWNNDWWGGSDSGGSWGDYGKMLHLRVGTKSFNLVEILYKEQTNFIGFISLEGFTSMELFTRETGESVSFTISDVLVSVGEPAYGNIFDYIFNIALQFFTLFISLDFSGLFSFISELFVGNGD